jgi:hypothetical protein
MGLNKVRKVFCAGLDLGLPADFIDFLEDIVEKLVRYYFRVHSSQFARDGCIIF